MPEYICNNCGNSFNAEPDPQGQIVCVSCREVMQAESARKPLAAGTRVNGYEIIRHIAAGGCGSVYLAEQISMERTVALKILNQEQVDKHTAERFLEEARNAAKFENPHVVPVLDTGLSPEGYYYIAMQYVEGETLEEILRRGRTFPEEETLLIGITVADTLRSIWNKYKMFHKDIKPGNIMLTPENEAMILDLGTAQEHGESKLADGEIEGSPYYMSPEQARGETLTWSTDLYSLGATMYQMVTGKYLFDGEEVESILRQHDSAPFPDPAKRAPEMKVSAGMTHLLEQMLGKKPSDRYASWDDFIRDARDLLKTIMEAKGSAAPEKLRKKCRQMDEIPDKPMIKPKKIPTPLRFLCFALLIFILTASLLGGIFLYASIRKNSSNAKILLETIRKQADNPQMNPDAVEAALRKAAPYFKRAGVLPSVRQEFERCQQKVKAHRERIQEEEKRIISLESGTAETLKSANEKVMQAKAAAADSRRHPAAEKHFKEALKALRKMKTEVRETRFSLLPNTVRAEQLSLRLETALQSATREFQPFQRKYAQNNRRPDLKKRNRTNPPPTGGIPAAKTSAPKRKDRPPVAAGQMQLPRNPNADFKNGHLPEREMDRIRIRLLLQNMKEKTAKDNPVWNPSAPLPQDPQFDQWRREMKDQISKAAKLWNTVYNSHQTFAGFHFTIPTLEGETRMELKTILKDTVVLYHRGMPNLRLTFEKLSPAEWMDFLRFAADRKGLRKELDSYLLLDGWFFAVQKSRDPFILREMPAMRTALFRHLAEGKHFSGTERPDETETRMLIRKYQIDPAFAPYRMKAMKAIQNQTANQKQKGKK